MSYQDTIFSLVNQDTIMDFTTLGQSITTYIQQENKIIVAYVTIFLFYNASWKQHFYVHFYFCFHLYFVLLSFYSEESVWIKFLMILIFMILGFIINLIYSVHNINFSLATLCHSACQSCIAAALMSLKSFSGNYLNR